MEEWEHLEGHKEIHKDVMMASQPALTSPDGSSNGNPPERCPCPLYSYRDPTQEGLAIPHHQSENLRDFNIVIKEEYKEEDEYGVMEEPPRNPPERCTSPYSHQNSTQNEELKVVKIEGIKEEEETLVSGDRPSVEEWEMTERSKQEESSLHKDPNGHFDLNTSEGEPIGCVEDDDITQSSPGRNPGDSCDRDHTGELSLSSMDCKKSLTNNKALPQQNQTGERPYSCSECGKCFKLKGNLKQHKRVHTGERPYSCSECGKGFTAKGSLVKHQRLHRGEHPYSCSECGKCFRQKEHLLLHQRIHTGEHPYSCSECGKCFKRKDALITHQSVHTGEFPYSCSECGKFFNEKRRLVKHQRVHTGERPYSCSECGKCFTDKGNLFKHQRVHTGERPYSCLQCGKCFTKKSTLNRHQQFHTGERA